METKYKVGDQVQLKSGGPIMTVALVKEVFFGDTETFKYRCTWFLSKDEDYTDMNQEMFYHDMLKPV